MTTENRASRRAAAKPAAKKPAAKKPAASRASSSRSKVQEPEKTAAHYTLTELDTEAAGIPEIPPFIFDLETTDDDGEPNGVIEIGNPAYLPYELAVSRDLDAVFEAAMSEDDWNKFLDAGFNSLQAGMVFSKWRQHYGMGSQGE